MTARLDYRWHLRKVMADRGMFSTTDLIGPLAGRGITLSSSQVYRLVTERPERLSLRILMALLGPVARAPIFPAASAGPPAAAGSASRGQPARRSANGAASAGSPVHAAGPGHC